MGWIASFLWSIWFAEPRLLLTEQLIEKLLENVVAHDTGVGVGLTFAMENRGGRLIDAVHLAKRVILVDGGVERAALDKRADLGHFRRGENRRDGAVHVAILFPLLLILKERLFYCLALAELCGSASVARRHTRIGVHRERKIAVNQENLAGADVIVHELAIGGGEQGFAGRALEVAKDLHRYWSTLRAKSLVRINVGDSRIGLRQAWPRSGRRCHHRRRQDRRLGTGRRIHVFRHGCGWRERSRRRLCGSVQGWEQQGAQTQQPRTENSCQNAPPIHAILQRWPVALWLQVLE